MWSASCPRRSSTQPTDNRRGRTSPELKQNLLDPPPACRDTALAMRLPANWQTTVSMIGGVFMGALTWLSTISYDQGAIAQVIPIAYKPLVLKIAGMATLILFVWNGIQQKTKSVTGGVVQQTKSGAVADAGTQTLVDQTIKASIASGDPSVTAEEKKAVQS